VRRVGIVGCGAIGTALAVALERDYANVARVVALVDRIPARVRALQSRLRGRPKASSLPELIRGCDLVIEAASVDVAAEVARRGLAAHRDVVIMSTGGLLLHATRWRPAARRSRGRLLLPSGALGGLDGLKALAQGRLRRICLTTSKPPASLASAPLIARRGIRLTGLRRPRVIFDGTPRQAIQGFPQNTNVAATLALAVLSGRPQRPAPPIRIRVVADPRLTRNVHQVDVEGDAGRLSCRMESRPSLENPKTSQVAIQAALATLAQVFEPVRIGT
jgi:aspartate dehydrogenase